MIADKQNKISTAKEHQNGLLFQFVPIVEPYDNGTVFVDRDVPTMNRAAWGNRIPLLIGGNEGEGYLLYGRLLQNNVKFDNSFFDNALPRELNLSEDDVSRRRLGEALRKFYYANEIPSISNIEPFIDLLSEQLFWHGIYGIVQARLANSDSAPTYVYHFDYSSDVLTMLQMLTCGKHVKHTVHGEDLLYQFRIPPLHDGLPDDCEEVRLREIYVIH